MKSGIYLYLIIAVFAASCGRNDKQITTDLINNPNSASGAANDNLPKFQFKEEIHNFGRVIEGEKVNYSFRFKNVGKSDLLISSASASCGCTVPEYPRKPIRTGEDDIIKVSFNTEGRSGMQSKTVTILANTQPNTKVLTIKAEVYTPEKK
jgi:hypothetical protein